MGCRRLVAAVVVGVVAFVGVISGCGQSDSNTGVSQAEVKRHLDSYRAHLIENSADLTEWVRQMRGQIVVEDLGKAQSRYATAKVQLGQIRPVVAFDSLAGFRAIERGIYGRESTKGLKTVAAELQAEAESLQKRLAEETLKPRQLLSAAVATVRRVDTVGLQGGEEPYSSLDLVDMVASVEGAQAATGAAEPLFPDEDRGKKLEVAFDEVYKAFKPYGLAAREPQTRPAAAGARFVEYEAVDPQERKELSAPLRNLLRHLNQVEQSLQGT